MALTVTGFSNASLTYKLAQETNAGVTPSVDIFGGGGTLQQGPAAATRIDRLHR